MKTCYNAIIRSYYGLILFFSLFNSKAKKWISGRKGWKENLTGKIANDQNWLWFHCSSLGEFEDCCEVFLSMRKEYPSYRVILTVFSPSAYEVLKESKEFDIVCYLPLDTKKNAKFFLCLINPKLILFSRSELWMNFLTEAKSKKIPIYLISLRLDEKSNFVKWPYKFFYKDCFDCFDYIYCQDDKTLKIMVSVFKMHNVQVTGNTRFERIAKNASKDHNLSLIERFASKNSVVVMGSFLPKDEYIFLEVYYQLRSLNIKWILVPHEIEKSVVVSSSNFTNAILYSDICNLGSSHDVIIVDSVGILKYIYKYARIALIGGGFDNIGIHNTIEAAVFGIPTAFGPNHRNYEEAIDLLRIGGASVYRNPEELKELIESVVLHPIDFILKEKISKYVFDNIPDSYAIISSIKSRTR